MSGSTFRAKTGVRPFCAERAPSGKIRGMKSAVNATLVVLLLLLAYALSVGPMFWLCSDPSGRVGGPHGKAFLIVYTPILWPYQNGPPLVRDGIHRYLSIFREP